MGKFSEFSFVLFHLEREHKQKNQINNRSEKFDQCIDAFAESVNFFEKQGKAFSAVDSEVIAQKSPIFWQN